MESRSKAKQPAPEAAKPPRKSGGPVFPQIFGKTFGPQTSGISLRDYLAASAMSALIARQNGENKVPDAGCVAAWAVDYADAMITELRQ